MKGDQQWSLEPGLSAERCCLRTKLTADEVIWKHEQGSKNTERYAACVDKQDRSGPRLQKRVVETEQTDRGDAPKSNRQF